MNKIYSALYIGAILSGVFHLVLTQLQEWKIPCGAIYKPKNCKNARVTTMTTIEDFERCGPAFLKPLARDFIWGGADNEVTLFENKNAFSKLWIRRRVLRGITNYTTESTVLSKKIRFPVGISPTAGQKKYHPHGEIGVAKAAAETGGIVVLNSYSTTPLEEVARSVPRDTQLWMNTYLFSLRENTVNIVRRAEAAGFKAIVLTVDSSLVVDIRCNSRFRFFTEFLKPLGFPNLMYADGESGRADVNYNTTFSDITWLTKITGLPIVAKGVMTVEDAIQALAAGAKAVMVSNHGGRESDGSLPTIEALPDIVKAVNLAFPDREVYIDGGVRSGQDVFKALALGARAVFVGRPPLWGLAMEGKTGVEKVLNILKNEFTKTMVNAGYDEPAKISSESVIRRNF